MDKSCLFCDIAEGRCPSKIAYKDEHIVAFHDTSPQAPTHLLLIPVKHIETVNDLKEEDGALIGGLVLRARLLAQELKIAEKGYRLIFNCNRWAGQSVFHIHLHLLGGRPMGWPPG